jgi:zinc transport system substrate-binding protein
MKKLTLVLLLVLSGCASNESLTQADTEPSLDSPVIVAGAFPVSWLASEIANGCAGIVDLTPAGGDVHDLELTPNQTAEIIDADLVITVSGFQPAFDDAALAGPAPLLDLLPLVNPIYGETHSHEGEDGHGHEGEDGHGHEDEDGHGHGHEDEDGHGHEEESESKDSKILDPHFWLDPNRAIMAATAIKGEIEKLSDSCAVEASANLQTLIADLTAVDLDFKSTLANCQSRTIVVSHEAFGYLSDAYQLKQVAVTGLDPASEPSASRIAEIIALAKKEQVSAVFSEESANPAVAEILANELQVGVLQLNPIELKPASLDYLIEMEQNLDNLSQGLNCR